MKAAARLALGVAVALAALGVGRSALLSKTFVFQPGAMLDIGTEIEPGIRLDTVRFLVPAADETGYTRTAGIVQAEVALSNSGSVARRVGVAIALFDESGRMLAVASGGDKVFALKPSRQGVYRLKFDHVNTEAARATRFQISAETW